jgi:hypothetical protein
MFWQRREHPSDEDLSALLDGELTGSRVREVSEHVDACERCAGLLGELRATRAALRSLPRPQAARSFRLGGEFARPRPAPSRRPAALSFAPAVALTLFVALLVLDVSGDISTREAGSDAGGAPAAESASKAQDATRQEFSRPSAADESRGPAGAPNLPPAAQTPITSRPEAGAAPPTEQETLLLRDLDSDSDRPWLRLLEIVAAIAFVASVALLWWPRLPPIRRRR